MIFIRCIFGIHDHQIIDEETIDKEWYKVNFEGKKIQGSDYSRFLVIVIGKCSRCNKKIAYRYMTNPTEGKEKLSIDFAEAQIAKVRAKKS